MSVAIAAVARVAEQFDGASQQKDASTLGMWAFIATEVLFFGVLFAGYTVCRVNFPAAFAAASRHTDITLGTIETAILLVSSFLAALAVRSIQLGEQRTAAMLLGSTALLGVSFLVLHGFEYHAEYDEGLIPGIRYTQSGPQAAPMQLFFCLYYLITGFHSLHVLIGVIVLTWMTRRVMRRDFSPGYFTPVELSVFYWHLVDIVWIFVFPAIYLIGRAA